MQKVTSNVWTDTTLRGCNPSMVVTSDGVVIVDTPQLPTKAVEMRREAEALGPIRYVINTEHHVDHIFGNYYFRGSGAAVVNHRELLDRFMVPGPEIDPFDYAHEALPADDPDGEAIFPARDDYYLDPNKGSIVFTGDTEPVDSVVELARGADMLVCMCWDTDAAMEAEGLSGGMTGTPSAATLAAQAGVRTLVLTHIGPNLDSPAVRDKALREAAAAFDGTIVFGEELMTLDVTGSQ